MDNVSNRRGFFRKLAPLAALAPVAVAEGHQTYELKPDKKYLVVCDVHQVPFRVMEELGKCLHKQGIDATLTMSPEDAIKLYELDGKAQS